MIPLKRIKEIKVSRKNHHALIDNNIRITWSEFEEQVSIVLANIVNMTDILKLKSVCYISPNRYELIHLASVFATLKVPFIGIDYTQNNNNIGSMLEVCECSILVISSSFCVKNNINLSEHSINRGLIDLDCLYESTLNYNLLLEDHGFSFEERDYSRPFNAISFTSGTSGVPKAAIRSSSFDLRRFSYFTLKYGFNSKDRHLLAMPLYHAAGNGWSRLFMSLGATLVIADPSKTDKIASLIVNEQITTSAMTPTILKSAVSDYKKSGVNCNQLDFILVGGKHLTTETKVEAISTFGPVIYEYYGTTETGVNTIAEPEDLLSKPASVGKPYDGNKIIILDKNNNVLNPYSKGRVAIYSYMNMDDYKNSNKQCFLHNKREYLITPETGYIDDQGYLFLSNRTQGATSHDLYSIQNEIEHINCVSDCAVIPDESKSGYFICVYVLDDGEFFNISDIEDDIKVILKKNKVKTSIIKKIDKVPYSPSGKVINKELINKLKDTVVVNSDNNVSFKSNSIFKFILGVILLILTAASWGAMFPITKNALKYTDAVNITLIRYGIASLIFIAILLFKEGVKSIIPDKNFWKLWFFGTLGFAGFSILAFAGLSMTKAEHGAIIMALMPLLTAIMLWVLKDKKPHKITIVSILLAFFGVFLVITKGSLSSISDGNLFAGIIILLGAFCWVTYTIGASYINGYSVLRYTSLSCFLGAISIFIIAMILYYFRVIDIPNLNVVYEIKYELIYLIVIAGVFAVFAWNKGIEILGPVNGVLFINLVPVTAFIIGLTNGVIFTNIETFGMLLTIFAIIINNLAIRLLNK
ncbi:MULTISPECIES: AMP-binding protein [Providencia]|uniref:AMP-binding protein n=1 Tax=Providencia alcalifaciens TaxID=126385 RepID=A0AAW9V669_9GAMM|nr:AMP-binding protein [Providencia alcalifaciens]EKT66162.1 hypothetical protein OO9_06357 [Providencia alcalifaciens Dmel2]MTC33142.1 AMP-binding protein [Providencia alcalifaciens]